MPLFETAASSAPVEAEALISITPGLFNNIFVNDIVFVAFEENALEKPIIIGKLYTGTQDENKTPGGAGILDTLKVRTSGEIPGVTTTYIFPDNIKSTYENVKTPKKMADYIFWLEKLTKKLFNQLESHFRCFKNWVQWQMRPENVEVDDGDLDVNQDMQPPCLYQTENKDCKVCKVTDCTRKNVRSYTKLPTDKVYPNL
jgi:hypothetical protein